MRVRVHGRMEVELGKDGEEVAHLGRGAGEEESAGGVDGEQRGGGGGLEKACHIEIVMVMMVIIVSTRRRNAGPEAHEVGEVGEISA
jgi:hypothetical protein